MHANEQHGRVTVAYHMSGLHSMQHSCVLVSGHDKLVQDKAELAIVQAEAHSTAHDLRREQDKLASAQAELISNKESWKADMRKGKNRDVCAG